MFYNSPLITGDMSLGKANRSLLFLMSEEFRVKLGLRTPRKLEVDEALEQPLPPE